MTTEREFYQVLLLCTFVLAAVIFLMSRHTLAPYGRHGRAWWSGPDLPSWAGWMLMELPQLVGFSLWFYLGARRGTVALVFLGLWTFHYLYRTFLYPFLPRASRLSASVVAFGFVLNLGFSYLNGRWLFTLGPQRGDEWLLDPRFLVGTTLFIGGFVLCSSSDRILRRLRSPGERGYKLPRGGAFRWVSSPNYLGELVEWLGWSLATWSLAGLAIAAISAANLVPRAAANHRWYHERFPDYPGERRALIPFLY